MKIYKTRWSNNENINNYLIVLRELFKKGGVLKKEYSPFNILNTDLIDLRGIELNLSLIQNITFEKIDFSFSNFSSIQIKSSTFKDVIFQNVDFSKITDNGNKFINCTFENSKFNGAIIGYNGTQFINCKFINCNFFKTQFIHSEYYKSTFDTCKLKSIDFNASSFEDCNFIGNLEDVWFRGNYALPSDTKEFGIAKQNNMKNVSFLNATLNKITFSNNCNLSTIILPNNGNYILFDNWKIRLEKLKKEIPTWELDLKEKNEANIFVNTYLVHAQNQDWNIINILETESDFGLNVCKKIMESLNHW